ARVRRIELKRNPNFRRIYLTGREVEAPRHHSDNGAFRSIEERVAADQVPIAAEGALPESLGDDGDAWHAVDVVLGGYQSARQGRHANGREQASGNERSIPANRTDRAGKACAAVDPCIQRLPGLGVAPEVQEFRTRNPESAQAATGKRRELRVDSDELIGLP